MTYALFRNRSMPDFHCAVPQGRQAPPFVQTPVWEFAGTTDPGQPRPYGFNEDVARFACQFQGFYIFRERSALERRLRPPE